MSGLLLGKQHTAPHVHLEGFHVRLGKGKPRVVEPFVRMGLAGFDGCEHLFHQHFRFVEEVLNAGGVEIAVFQKLASGHVAVESPENHMVLIADGLPFAERREHGANYRKEKVRRGEQKVDIRIRLHRALQVRESDVGVPFRGYLDGILGPEVRVLLDYVEEALPSAHGVRIAEITDHDSRRDLPTEFHRLLGHVLHRGLGDNFVVGDDDQSRSLFAGRRPVEDTDRYSRVVRLFHDCHGALAVLRNDDNAVNVLGNYVPGLLELPIRVLVGVFLDNANAVLSQGLGNRLVPRNPELGLEVLEEKGDRDVLRLLSASREDDRGKEGRQNQENRNQFSLHTRTPLVCGMHLR